CAPGLRAEEAAERAFAFEAALTQYECVLELWPGVPQPESVAGVDRVGVLSRAPRTGALRGAAAPPARTSSAACRTATSRCVARRCPPTVGRIPCAAPSCASSSGAPCTTTA